MDLRDRKITLRSIFLSLRSIFVDLRVSSLNRNVN